MLPGTITCGFFLTFLPDADNLSCKFEDQQPCFLIQESRDDFDWTIKSVNSNMYLMYFFTDYRQKASFVCLKL